MNSLCMNFKNNLESHFYRNLLHQRAMKNKQAIRKIGSKMDLSSNSNMQQA